MFANKSCLNIINEKFIFVIFQMELLKQKKSKTKKRQQPKHDKY